MKPIIIGFLVVAVIYICIQAFGLLLVLALLKKREQDPDPVNHSDVQDQTFRYRVDKPLEEILSILSQPGRFQDYRYAFDPGTLVITFSREQIPLNVRCWVFLYPDDTGCNLRIKPTDGWDRENACPRIQDPFWQHLLDARPIPYSEEKAI